MDLFLKLEQNKAFMQRYNKYKEKRIEKEKNKRVKGKYIFEDRKKDNENMCIILAGYKEYLYEDVFSRIKEYIPKDNMDVCIASSGKYCKNLSEIAKKNGWSYLSTKRNNVAIIQNIAIDLHKKAKKIFKLDEDIFVTQSFFNICLETFDTIEKKGEYNIGFIAPTIPINGYSNVDVLKLTGCLEDYESKFGKAKRDSRGKFAQIINNPEIAKYFWGETREELRDIDKLSNKMSNEEFSFSTCPIIFSIGAILFSREVWEDMGRFKVNKGSGMGADESQICSYCMTESKAIIVSNNTLVGHFSYGPQTSEMKKYYQENREIFKLKK